MSTSAEGLDQVFHGMKLGDLVCVQHARSLPKTHAAYYAHSRVHVVRRMRGEAEEGCGSVAPNGAAREHARILDFMEVLFMVANAFLKERGLCLRRVRKIFISRTGVVTELVAEDQQPRGSGEHCGTIWEVVGCTS